MNDDILKEKQKTLFSKFNKEYYHKTDISKILNIPPKQVDEIVEGLKWHPHKGYHNLDLIIKLMGGIGIVT